MGNREEFKKFDAAARMFGLPSFVEQKNLAANVSIGMEDLLGNPRSAMNVLGYSTNALVRHLDEYIANDPLIRQLHFDTFQFTMNRDYEQTAYRLTLGIMADRQFEDKRRG